jgi:predicted nucleic acid-binding protein
MVYVDTNVLIYISVNQDGQKRDTATRIIRELIKNDEFFLSTLTLQEFIFTLAKLNIDLDQVSQDINFYMDYVHHSIDKNILKAAFALCKKINFCKNFNDAIHLKLAEQYCQKLITYDNDFRRFKDSTNIEIQILGD